MKTYTEAQCKMMAALGVTEADCEPKQPSEASDIQALNDRIDELEEQLEAARILLGVDE